MAHGGQSWLRRWPVDSFFPPCCCEAAMLEEGVSDHRHKRMTVKALPGSSLERRSAGHASFAVVSSRELDEQSRSVGASGSSVRISNGTNETGYGSGRDRSCRSRSVTHTCLFSNGLCGQLFACQTDHIDRAIIIEFNTVRSVCYNVMGLVSECAD